MNKKILGLIAVFAVILIVLLIVLANRKGNTPTNGNMTPTPTSNNQKISLTWWNLFEPEANIAPLIAAFNQVYPNIEIQYVQVGKDGVANYRGDIESVLADEDIVTSPDIFPIHNSWAGKYQKLTSPAPSSVINQTDLDAFYSVVKEDFSSNGSVYAVPLYLDSIAIIYNKTLLANEGYTTPAKSWGDFELQAKNLTKFDANSKIIQAGFSAYYPNNAEFYFEIMNNLLRQNGVVMLDATGKSKISAQQEANSAILAYEKFVKGEYKSWDETLNKDIALFLEGKLAMYPAPTWRLNDILKYNQQYSLGLDVGVSQIPQYYNSQEYYYPSYWGLTVSKDSQHAEAAWNFIKFITSAEQLKTLNDTVIANGRVKGIIYPLKAMAEENLLDPLLAPYVNSLGLASNWKMYDGFALKKSWDEVFESELSIKGLENSINSVVP